MEVWEPWVPEIGQRVKAIRRAECPCLHLSPPGATYDAVVVRVDAYRADGHRFLIDVGNGMALRAAAIELEPLDAALAAGQWPRG